METFEIAQQAFTPTDPRLGRHIRHDSRSRSYAYQPTRRRLSNVTHERFVPIFNQGDLGSCVPNAGEGCLGTGKFYATVKDRLDFSQPEIQGYYRKMTRADTFAGAWEPDDTGTDGLACATVFKTDKLISGYQHAFSLNAMLDALQAGPVIIGINWYDSMFYPDSNGFVKVASGSGLAGGHEIVVDRFNADEGYVDWPNSWDYDWGIEGRGKMTLATLGRLLSENGDVTIFTPITAPAPVPIDPPHPIDTDKDVLRLAKNLKTWRKRRVPLIGAFSAQRDVNTFLRAKGY